MGQPPLRVPRARRARDYLDITRTPAIRSLCKLRDLDIQHRLGSNLRRRGDEKKWSQKAFADEPASTASRSATSSETPRNPTILVLEKIANALGESAGSLLDQRSLRRFGSRCRASNPLAQLA